MSYRLERSHGHLLTITLVELIVAGDAAAETALKEFLIGFASQMGLGVILGLFGGFLIVRLVNRLELAAGLYPILVISLALVLFGAVGLVGGSGFLAVFVAGLYAGNRRMRSQGDLAPLPGRPLLAGPDRDVSRSRPAGDRQAIFRWSRCRPSASPSS